MTLETARLTRRAWLLIAAVAVVALFAAAPADAQNKAPGGFLADASDSGLRAPLSAGEVQAFLPQRGKFTFPAPYKTAGVRLTNASDCGGSDCLHYVGYSYWRNINNHVGSDTMLVVLSLRNNGGPTLFTYNKQSGQTRNAGPLFDANSPFRTATGEGWYFSASRPTTYYLNDTQRMLRYDVVSKTFETVFDVRDLLGPDKRIKQMHSSNDDRVHSATVQDANWSPIGCVAYREDTRQHHYYAAVGDFDECQIDKSGRWLVIKENVDRQYNEDNRVIDLATGAETVLWDQNGAAGHSDVGYGYIVGEDDRWGGHPFAVRVWQFGPNMRSSDGRVVYHLNDWNGPGLGHVAHSNSQSSSVLNEQMACSSNADRAHNPRRDEIVCFRLDGSLKALIVAPNMTDLSAPGGGQDDYEKRPKGNLDVTGEYFIWSTNMGGGRADAFIVRVPSHLLGVAPSTSSPSSESAPAPAPEPEPAPAPAPEPTPAPAPSSGDAIRWLTLVNTTADGNTLVKTGGCDGCGDAFAVSEGLVLTDGAVEFTPLETAAFRFVGLGTGGAGTAAGDLDYALRLQAGVVEVRERGAYKSETSFAAGDRLRISVDGGVVRYLKNGAVFYSSATPVSGQLRLHVILFTAGATIGNVSFGLPSASASEAEPAPAPAPAPTTSSTVPSWMSLVNLSLSGGGLVKTGGCDGCPDGTAVSDQQISTYGHMEFVAGEIRTLRFVGLGSGGVGTAPAGIEFALRLQNGVVEVREQGAYRVETGFAAGDVLRIAVDGGVVRYLKNGAVFHTSASSTAGPLRVHVVMFDAGAAIGTMTLGTVSGATATSINATASATPTATRRAQLRPANVPPRRRGR